MTATSAQLLAKYGQIIAEEVNVKQVWLIENTDWVRIQYLPNGRELGADFGKDTWQIIWSAKSGNALLNNDGTLTVTWSAGQERVLQDHQFEVRYTWFDAPHQVVESWAMIELDLETTQDLIDEWVAREISRFLNQMRKDADFDVSDRVALVYRSDSEYLKGIVTQYTTYLQQEALLTSVTDETTEWSDHIADFEYEEGKMSFGVKR